MDLPKRLGNYELIELIGSGGQGKVYKAIDASLQRIVAIKVFFSGKGNSTEEQLAAFIYEARLASSLDHPNICRVYSLVDDGSQTYMVMEYVAGKNLFELAYGRPLAIESAVRIVIQVTEALWVAHRNGIIHRDIKPRNVMVTPSGQIRILDFGLAKLLERPDGSYAVDDEEITVSGAQLDIYSDIAENLYVTPPGTRQGTPSTSAPEMAEGKATDERSDVFSTGVLLYLLLTGKYPFMATTKKEVLDKVVNEDPEPVSVAREHGKPPPLSLIAVVQRSLQKDPDRRFQSMREMRDALIAVKGEIGDGSEASEPAFNQEGEIHFAAPNRRPRSWRILISIAVLFLATIFVFLWFAVT